MFNLFKRPIEKETLDDWAKIANDIAKVAMLAVPVVLIGDELVINKIIKVVSLLVATYASLQSGRIIRRFKQSKEGKQ
ncbi:hypothetical protein [Actinobacillus porcinus]|uniref:hypothetical protein n=1 Tax=Actinobacillus porcinus TaxID=51048 RepID=UPI0023562CA9|nr:hypothetical protein [Actinobacillus porcinus]